MEEFKDQLLITVDVEPDCDIHWQRSNPPTFVSVLESIPRILRPLWDKYGIKPIYFVSPEILQNEENCLVLRAEIERGAIIGAHLHSEYIEPNITFVAGYSSLEYPCYAHSDEVEFQKIKNLTDLIEKKLGIRPEWYRAARFGADINTIKSLHELGYKYDSSITPFIDWSKKGGPNHRLAPTHFYWIAKDNFYEEAASREASSGIMEFPITIRGKRFGIFGRFLPDKWFFYRWLRPTILILWEMKSLVRECYREKRGFNLVMMFHSMELIPKSTPLVRTKLTKDLFIKRLDKIIAFIQKEKTKHWEEYAALDSDVAACLKYTEYNNEPGGMKKLNFALKAIKENNSGSAAILDVGCGNGNVSFPLAYLGYDVLAVDISEELIIMNSRKYFFPNLSFQILDLDAATISLPKKFNVILLLDILEHLERPDRLIVRLAEYCQADAILIVSIPNGFGFSEIVSRFVRWLEKIIRIKFVNRFKKMTARFSVQSDNYTPHLHYFKFKEFISLVEKNDFHLVACQNSTVFSSTLRWRGKLEQFDLKLADLLPKNLASGWYLIFKKNDKNT